MTFRGIAFQFCSGFVALRLAGAARAQMSVITQHNELTLDYWWYGLNGSGHSSRTVTSDTLTSYSNFIENHWFDILHHRYGLGSARIGTSIAPARIVVDGATTAGAGSYWWTRMWGAGSQITKIQFQTAISGRYQLSARTSQGKIDFKKDGDVVFHLDPGGSALYRSFQLEAGHTYELDAAESGWSTYQFSIQR